MVKKLNKLKIPEFVDFNESVNIALEANKKKELRRCYLPRGDVITIAGYRTLETPALFTTKEEGTIDVISFLERDRLVFTGLKQRAVIRRIHSDLLRGVLGDEYKCVVPDNLCGSCSNCFLFGSLNPETNIAVKSRANITTSYSIEESDKAISDEEEFHIMVHSNLSMVQNEEERAASIYINEVIRPGTVFPFVVYLYSPTQFDVVSYIKSHSLADKKGYGNYSAIRGQCKSEFLLITKNLSISPSTMLEKSKKEILDSIDLNLSIIDEGKIENLANEFDDLAKTYKKNLFNL